MRQTYDKGGPNRELNWKEEGVWPPLRQTRGELLVGKLWRLPVVVKAPFTSTRSFCDRLLCVPENVRVVPRVVGQRRRHVDHFRYLLSFSTLAYGNRAYSTCSNFASLGSSDRCFLLFRRRPLSFFRARARTLSKAAGGLMHSFVAVDGIKISVALL